jgi:hypothetical protein
MNLLRKARRIGSDERAQAMTEFVIVIPLVLFLFFAMLQTMMLAKASQLSNYAAFAAARSYATSFSKFFGESGDGNDAHDKATERAKNTALLVMAPISHAQAGEALPIWRPLRNSVKNQSQKVQELYGLAEGYVTAMIFRMKGFNLTLSGGADDPKSVVRVNFDYLMPISIPGFAEMWNYLRVRDKSASMLETFDLGAPFVDPSEMSSALTSVLDGLGAVEDIVDDIGGGGVFGGITDQIESIAEILYGGGYAGAMHNVTLKAKSICGFEPWSGTVRTDDIKPYCEGEFDKSMQPCIDASRASDDLIKKQTNECAEAEAATKAYEDATNKLAIAKSAYNNCPNSEGEYVTLPDAYGSPSSVKSNCKSEWKSYQDARKVADAAYEKMKKESQECKNAGNAVKNAQKDMAEKCKPPI